MMDGVLVIDKPAGMTSHDVVARARKVFKMKKVGHAGTLDPQATGLLVLGLGAATRFLRYAQTGTKRYEATAMFGITTTTQDASGQILSQDEPSFARDDLETALRSFRGKIQQIPPMTSAVRIEGERLYRKAQRGEEVERPSRTVTIHGLRLVRFELPEADLDITCSGGTYIRTLINDIGKALGCGAHMKTLRRTEAAGFTLEDAIPLEQLEPSHLRPVEDAARGLARVDLDQPAAQDARHGRPLAVERANAEGPRPVATEGLAEEGEPIAVFFDGKLLGVYRRSGDRLVAERVMPE